MKEIHQMSRDKLNSLAADVPPAIHPLALRGGLALVIFVAMVAFAARITA
jgi:hypothetical protein